MATFTGGDKLKARLAEMAKKLEKKATLGAGFPQSAGYEEGSSLSVAAVAAIQEFGAPGAGIPPRSFMRTTVARHSDEWADIVSAHLASDDYDPEVTLKRVGETIRDQIKDQIQQTSEPALSPITLMLRKMFGNDRAAIRGADVGQAARRVAAGEQGATGSQAHPLIWTGYMLSRVTYEVTT